MVASFPESPTVMAERRDDLESVFQNIRSASNRQVLAFDLSAPSMPDMMMMPAPALPTPAMNQSSKQKNEMSNSNNDHNANANANAPMKKKKKNLHMGRRLRQIKKRLTSSKSGYKSSPSKQVKEEVCLSNGTSAKKSTLSFGPTSEEEEEDDVPFMDEMDRMTMNMTTTLKPRVCSMFPEEEEDRMLMMPTMPVLPAPPCPLSTSSDEIRTATPPPPSLFSSTLNKALSVLSLDDDDDDDDDAGNAVDDTDDWGIFASFDDEDDDDDEGIDDDYNHHHVSKFSSSSRSFVTKSSNALYFQPRTHLPAVFAATAGAE